MLTGAIVRPAASNIPVAESLPVQRHSESNFTKVATTGFVKCVSLMLSDQHTASFLYVGFVVGMIRDCRFFSRLWLNVSAVRSARYRASVVLWNKSWRWW